MGLQDADKLGHAGPIATVAKSCCRGSLMYLLTRPDALDEVGDKHHGMFSASHMNGGTAATRENQIGTKQFSRYCRERLAPVFDIGTVPKPTPYLCMDYKGIEYEVLRTANPTGWKWIVHLDAGRRKSGISFSRPMAITSAKHAINKTLKVLAQAK
jgi:hypothetical protein